VTTKYSLVSHSWKIKCFCTKWQESFLEFNLFLDLLKIFKFICYSHVLQVCHIFEGHIAAYITRTSVLASGWLCCLQVVQLEELLEVRHSVFVVGNAGTGKTQVWKTLFRAYQNMKRKPIFNDLNPKAVTNDELFGIINPNTREWKDGEYIICITL